MQLVRRALLALLATFVLATPAFAAEFRDFTPQAFAAAQAENAPILLVVFADWCPTCHAQEAAIHDAALDHGFDQMIVLRIDFDHQRDVWRGFGVQQRSTLIAFHGRRETGRSLGDTDTRHISALMRTALH
jgi:thioredoxin-like negative regulator of GroEL